MPFNKPKIPVKKLTKPILSDPLGAGQNRLINSLDVSGSRFRKRYRTLQPHELAYGDAIKDYAAKLEYLIEQMGSTRLTTLALTYLEIAVFWAIKEQTGKPVGNGDKIYTAVDVAKILNIARKRKAD